MFDYAFHISLSLLQFLWETSCSLKSCLPNHHVSQQGSKYLWNEPFQYANCRRGFLSLLWRCRVFPVQYFPGIRKKYLYCTNRTSLPPLTIDFLNGYRSLLEGLLPSECTNLHCYLLIVARIHVRRLECIPMFFSIDTTEMCLKKQTKETKDRLPRERERDRGYPERERERDRGKVLY